MQKPRSKTPTEAHVLDFPLPVPQGNPGGAGPAVMSAACLLLNGRSRGFARRQLACHDPDTQQICASGWRATTYGAAGRLGITQAASNFSTQMSVASTCPPGPPVNSTLRTLPLGGACYGRCAGSRHAESRPWDGRSSSRRPCPSFRSSWSRSLTRRGTATLSARKQARQAFGPFQLPGSSPAAGWSWAGPTDATAWNASAS